MKIAYHKNTYWVGFVKGGLALLLTGCGPDDADQTSKTSDVTTHDDAETSAIDSDIATTTMDEAKPDGKAEDKVPAKASGDMNEPSSSDTSFPAKFQGRWALNVSDCPKARGMETTVMTIDDKSAQFYESMASLKSARQNGDTFNVTLRWTGEGQNWDSETAFTLKDGGKMLTRADAGIAEVLIYKKCPT